MKRIPQLDGVRGIAILMVLVWHYFVCQVMAAEPGGVVSVISSKLILTWSGVDLFFVLSGFLIAGILLDHKETTNYFRIFYLRRVCRILPLYFLLLGLYLAVSLTSLPAKPAYSWLLPNPLPIWSYATFTQNIFMGLRGDFGPHWLGVTWSLAVEEQFYLVVPVLVYFLPRKVLLLVLFAAIIAAPILRSTYPGLNAFINTPWRSDSILSGAALAVLVRWNPFIAAVRKLPWLLLLIFLALLAGAIQMTLKPGLMGVWNHFWLAAFYAVFILMAFANSLPILGRILASSLLVWFGRLSYGIYMFHQAVSGLMHGAFGRGAPQMLTGSDMGITLGSLVITLLLAMISFRFFESPILNWGHRFKYQQRHSADHTK